MKARDSRLIREATEVAMFSVCNDELSQRYFDLKRRRALKRLEREIESEECAANSMIMRNV